MNKLLSLLLLLILSSCGKINAPGILTPSENQSIQKVSFGDQPISYQNILKEYLIKNLQNYKTAKVEFINEPSKLSINHLGSSYSGYRVCLSINEKKGDYYAGYKNHFFLINNGQVNFHLFDSGLLLIPFEYCVSRVIDNAVFIDDIPDNSDDKSVESMDSIRLSSKNDIDYKKLEIELDKLKKENQELRDLDEKRIESNEKNLDNLAKIETPEKVYGNKKNVYILCTFDSNDTTYIFNADKGTFRLINKLDIVSYSVNFNDAYIVATNENIELTINRVSGDATLETKLLKKGMCKLTNKVKF